MQLLKKLARREGKIIFQSTHDVNMALQLADRIWLVDKNLGVSIGTPSELDENGELVRFFSGDGIRRNESYLIGTAVYTFWTIVSQYEILIVTQNYGNRGVSRIGYSRSI